MKKRRIKMDKDTELKELIREKFAKDFHEHLIKDYDRYVKKSIILEIYDKAKTQTRNEIIELIEIKGYMERWQKDILIKEIKELGK